MNPPEFIIYGKRNHRKIIGPGICYSSLLEGQTGYIHLLENSQNKPNRFGQIPLNFRSSRGPSSHRLSSISPPARAGSKRRNRAVVQAPNAGGKACDPQIKEATWKQLALRGPQDE